MNLIEFLLSMQTQLRIYHWQTNIFAEHKALGEAYESLDPLIDKFIETSMGAHKKIKSNEFNLSLKGYDDKFQECIASFIVSLKTDFSKSFQNDTDLLNIRDEILGNLNRLMYLLTLK